MLPNSALLSGPRACVWRCIVVFAYAGAAFGCAKGGVSSGTLPGVPTIDNLPQVTAQAAIAVTGTRPADTTVTAQFSDGATQMLAAAGNVGATAWTGTLALAEGRNAFVLMARDAAGNVRTSQPYTITRTTAPPQAPSVDGSYQRVARIYTAQGSAPVLSGHKDPNTAVWINGAVVQPLGPETTWQYSLPPLATDTPLHVTLASTNAAGHTSEDVAIDLYATLTPPVHIDAVVSPTHDASVTVTGTRAPGATVHVLWQDQDIDSQVATPDATHFSFLARLRATGVQDGVLVAVVYQRIAGQQGPFTVVPIAYDSVPPVAPVITAPLPFGGQAPIIVAGFAAGIGADANDPGAPASLQLTGTLPEPQSTLCIGLGTSLPCRITQGPADVFAAQVPLQTGINTLFVSAVDVAGNQSQVVTQIVYVTTPPALVIDSPSPQDLVQGDSVAVTGHVYLSPGDAAVPAAAQALAMAYVEVCLDHLTCQMADVSRGVFAAVLPLTGLGSGAHTLGVVGTSSAGTTYRAQAGSAGAVPITFVSSAPVRLNGSQTTVLGARAPAIAIDAAGTVHIAWEDFCPNLGPACPVTPTGNVGPDIFYTSRDKQGVWAKTVRSVSAQGARDGQSRSPTIAVDKAGLVHIAWSDNGPITGSPSHAYGILHRTLDPQSGAWSSINSVTGQDGRNAKQPYLANNLYGAGSQVYLTWQTDSIAQAVQTGLVGSTGQATFQSQDIYYAQAQGTLPLVANTPFATWTAPLKVTADPNTGAAAFPQVAMGPDQHVSIVWQECRGASCQAQPRRNHVRLMDVPSATSLDPLGSVVVNDSPTDRSGVHPTVNITPDNAKHIIWEGLSETGGANPNVPAIFARAFLGRTPDSRLPAALWLSQGLDTAAQAPWVTGAADGRFAIAWTQRTASASRTSRVAVRTGTVKLGPGPKATLLPDTGSVALHAGIALDPFVAKAVHVVWDNTLTLGVSSAATTPAGAFYAIVAQ